ncbi:MAG: NAD(P)/FAD-dependent oxidoreductase, partial [Pseudomonadota bacterium]
MQKFDIIIIGGGNAGFGVSAVANEAGKSVAFIEERDFGGTCPNRGCTPKKVLVAAAHAMHEIENASAHAIEVGKPKLNWEKLITRKDDMIDFIPGAMQGLAEKRGTVFQGRAEFAGPNTVSVNGTEIEGENIVIATGSKPRDLPIPGAELMITSDEVLSDKNLPGEVVFIGGGVIAMEFSHVYARAGAKVTILEAMPQLLPRMDHDAVDVLKKATEALGVSIQENVQVKEIAELDGRLSVSYLHDGEQKTVSADRVVNGAGRVANVDGLNLEAANIEHDGIRIAVHDHLQSVSNPAIWVAGDALVNSAQLSPLATAEGKLVARNIISGGEEKPDYTANA